MSVIGFDIGNENCVIAAAKRGGIDVLLNDEAKRESPGVVSFGDKQRFMGSAGAAVATANPKSTISQIKRLIGRQYKEPSVQNELKLLPFVTSEGPRGGILIELEYLKIEWKLTPVEILGMLFIHLKQIAEKNLESTVLDCVIGIPSYFTDLQRHEYLDAATIAGLNPLRLMHDGTAIALGYGMYKTDLLDSGPTNVIFVDIGHCDTQVTVAAFELGKMDILTHSFDENLGGRDFDEVLFQHFAAQFLEQYKIDVYSNARASIRLRASCEKLKKVLSANTEAPLSIECLIEDTDVRGIITRDEFEKLSSELLQRVTASCCKALKDSGLSVDKIYTIELVGSGSRIPAITKSLTDLFQKEPTRTLNASECVARGCALRCAMLSPTLQVRDYKVKDLFPYSIALPLDELKYQGHKEIMLFPKGSLFPNTHLITHNGSPSIYFQVLYTNLKDLPAGVSPLVGHFKIDQHETSDSEKVKVEVVVMLNHHGILEIKSASVLIDERPSHMNILLHSQKMVTNTRILNIAFSENLDVATTKDELLEAQRREQMFAEQDKKVEQTKDQRNTLESFVYDTRSKLKCAYKRFVTDLENDGITQRLQETEEWLYEDSDDESDEQDYAGKLEGLKKLLEPIENRYKDENKAQATKPLLAMIEEYRSVADSLQPINKKELIKACKKVEQYLEAHSPKDFDQIGWSNFIKKTMDIFKRMCEAVEKKVQATKPLLAMIEEYRLVADSLPLENKMQLKNACAELDQDLSGHSPENYDPIDWSNIIKKTMGTFKRHCEKARQYKPSLPEHPEPVELDQSCNHMDSQTGNPLDAKQKGKSMDGNQTGKPVEKNKTSNPMKPDQSSKPMKPDQTSKSVNPDQTSKPVKPDQTSKPMKPDQTSKPVKSDKSSKPVEPDQSSMPVEPDQSSMPVEPDQSSMAVKPNQSSMAVKPNQSSMAVKPDQSSMAVKPDQSSMPVKPDQTSMPVKPDQKSMPMKPDQPSMPVKPDQASKPVNMGQPDKPFDSEQMDIPDDMGQPDKPFDSEQIPDDMEVDGGCISL